MRTEEHLVRVISDINQLKYCLKLYFNQEYHNPQLHTFKPAPKYQYLPPPNTCTSSSRTLLTMHTKSTTLPTLWTGYHHFSWWGEVSKVRLITGRRGTRHNLTPIRGTGLSGRSSRQEYWYDSETGKHTVHGVCEYVHVVHEEYHRSPSEELISH